MSVCGRTLVRARVQKTRLGRSPSRDSDAEDVQAHLIGVFDLLDEVSQTVLRAHGKTAVVERGCDAVNPDLDQWP